MGKICATGLVVGIVLLLFCGGCNRIVYLDQPTPAGTVPPPSVSSKTTDIQSNQDIERVNPQTQQPKSSSVTTETQANRQFAAEISEGTIKSFKHAYAEQDRPRIAVLLNRSLTDEIREWYTPSRMVVSGKIDASETTVAGGATHSTNSAGEENAIATTGKKTEIKGNNGSVYEQKHVEFEGRDAPPEDWMWQFEESFLGEFLEAKAFIVDRATIMRLTASESGKQGSAHDLLAAKEIEMKSLQQKADLFMELLVRKNTDSSVGYEFRATVKEVPTGRILAAVSSLRWTQEELSELAGKKRFKATDKGYEEIAGGTFPKLDRVAKFLALDVMKSLTRIWAKE